MLADLDEFTGRVAVLLGAEDPLVRATPWQGWVADRERAELWIRSAGHDVLAHHHREAAEWVGALARPPLATFAATDN